MIQSIHNFNIIIKFKKHPANACPPEAAAVQTVEEVHHEIGFELPRVVFHIRINPIARKHFFSQSNC